MKFIIFFMLFVPFLAWCTTQNTQSVDASIEISEKIESVFVDVREDSEWAEWHIQGAIHLRLWEIESGNVASLPKDKKLILYCRSGRRSAIALENLKKLGFTTVSDTGGMTSIPNVTIIQ